MAVLWSFPKGPKCRIPKKNVTHLKIKAKIKRSATVIPKRIGQYVFQTVQSLLHYFASTSATNFHFHRTVKEKENLIFLSFGRYFCTIVLAYLVCKYSILILAAAPCGAPCCSPLWHMTICHGLQIQSQQIEIKS